jgi:hypothetical protein
MAAEVPRYRYRVDAADVLVWVDALWLAFARENGAAELVKESVLGRLLWDFVSGNEIRRLYLEIHSRVRISGHAVVLPFRCDSPSLQRHMRLTIAREDAGHLAYECLLVRAVPQRNIGALDSQSPRSEAFLTMCSCCKRTLFEPIGWLEVEDVSVRLGLFETRKVPELRHTICPECANTLRNASNNGNAA